jgi:hypothetical protein
MIEGLVKIISYYSTIGLIEGKLLLHNGENIIV